MDIISILNYLFGKLTFLSFADNDESVSGFIDDLKAALQRQGIFTFSADRRMVETAESVPSHIFEVIQGSQICIVVFTRNYADSVWCLEELAEISAQSIVIPIFYRVSPAHVQKQSSYYQGAFADHEEKFRHSLHQVQRWRVAMKQVASLGGWLAWIGSESQVIDDIVRYIMKKLGDDCPIGMETRVKTFVKFLNIGSEDDVGFVGISGMCGIGKSCLVQEVYDRICHRFDAHYFLLKLDQSILQQLEESLMDDDNQPRCCKTLLVIDNAKEYNQLKVLARNYSKWFGRGSRIIVTTRDKAILRRCHVNKIYEVELLNNDEARQLFLKHAHSGHNIDRDDDEEFIHCVLNYANGLPLAIQSLGCSLNGLNPLERKCFLEKMEQCPDDNIMLPLLLSLLESRDFELEIFFCVARYFNGKYKSDAIRILDSLNFCNNGLGIQRLQEKSLINIRNGKIWMHNLLEQVGRKVAQRSSLFSKFQVKNFFSELLIKCINQFVSNVILHTSIDYISSQYVDLELLEQALHLNHYASTIPADYDSIQDEKDRKYRAFISLADDDNDSFSTFIQHLIAALRRVDISTSSADGRTVKTAESVSLDILEKIRKSHICIVVFTRNYADSVWRLEELAKISAQRIVIPIFYRVSPAKVQNQSSYFQGAFAKLEEKFRDSLKQVESWREAMRQVASLRGWRAWIGTESQVIDSIVKHIMGIFDHNDLVGMDARVEALQELLNIASDDDVGFVGISGMCGIGKTCLAQEVYERIYHRFDAHCFLYNNDSLLILQQRLRESLMDDNNQPRYCKTLVVMDNVKTLKQLQFLAEYVIEFVGGGSRIIITTRDESILRDHGVDKIYKVELLKQHETLQLFCKHAFKCDKPPDQDYERLANVVLKHANGLPVAIQSSGSALFGRSHSEWESYVKKLQQRPANKNIMLLLKSSFDELSGYSREIFLDIACFFHGKDERHVMRILDSCCFFHKKEITELQDRSLIDITSGKFWMHNLLQQLGMEIILNTSVLNVHGETRLWLIKDFLRVSATEFGSSRVNAVVLDLEVSEETPLKFEALSKMKNLRLLIIRNVNFVGQLCPLPWKLRYVSWHKFPFTYFPLSIEEPLLVDLIVPHSSITQLWPGIKTVPRLRNLDLHGSECLEETPNFEGLPNLESLDLEGCSKIQQIDSSIETLAKIKFLNLRKCINLVSIPNSLFDVPSLEMLNLAGCSGFEKVLNFDSVENTLEVELEISQASLATTSQGTLMSYDENNSSEIIAQLKQEIHDQKKCYEASLEKVVATMQAREEESRVREQKMDQIMALMSNHFKKSNNEVGSSSQLERN